MLIGAGQVVVGPAHNRFPDGAVLVEGDSIAAVGPRASVAAKAPNATIIDYPHATLLPGLINCHVHLAFGVGVGALTALQEETDDARLLLAMAGRARQVLDSGVTTARDLGDRGALAVRLREAIAAGQVPGPRLLTATAPLTPVGGHCWFLGGAIDDLTDPDLLRTAVRRAETAGADVVKVMASGGGTTAGGAAMWESQFTTDQLKVLVDESHRIGLPVAAHAHGTDSIVSAVAAGVDTIEHCTWMSGGPAFAPREAVSEVVDRIVGAGISVCPAHSYDWQFFVQMAGEEAATELLGRLRWLADRGVNLIAGTDAGLAPFGDLGLPRLADWAFPPEWILDMATTRAADALGLGATVGSLQCKFSADLLVVNGDPLRDITALHDVEMVMARGRPYAQSQP